MRVAVSCGPEHWWSPDSAGAAEVEVAQVRAAAAFADEWPPPFGGFPEPGDGLREGGHAPAERGLERTEGPAGAGSQEAVVADPVEARREGVLEKAAQVADVFVRGLRVEAQSV